MTVFERASVPGMVYTLSREYYTPATFAREMDQLFMQQWLYVGRSEQLPEVGSYMLVTIANENVIVVRNKQGNIRAFYNLCRHRGTRMCTAEQGQFANSIQCPYHAWTYSLDGDLVGARLMDEVEGFDKAEFGLLPVAVVEWEGFIMLNLAPHPEPFEQVYAPLINRFSDWNIANLNSAQTIEYTIKANWKLIFQNYSECYHCPLIHPELVQQTDYRSGQNDLTEGPFLGGYMVLNDTHGTFGLGEGVGSHRPPVGTVAGEDLQRVYFYSIFPNMLLSLHPDYVLVHALYPLDNGTTRIVCDWLFDPMVMAQPDFDPSDAVSFWDTTNMQDWNVCEQTQLGVQSRAFVAGPYAQAEGLLYAFDQEYLRAMGEF